MKTFPTGNNKSAANPAFHGGGGNRTREALPTGHSSSAVTELNYARVGELLVRAVCASALLRHNLVRYTARDYLHPESLEEQFVAEILADKPTDELNEKWFNGDAVRFGMAEHGCALSSRTVTA